MSLDERFCFVLFCFVLFCFVLCCVVLCCVVLCCVVFCCFVLFCFVLFCFDFCFVLFCFVLLCFAFVFVLFVFFVLFFFCFFVFLFFFQVIILSFWIFSLILKIPLFLVSSFDEERNTCVDNFPKKWMPKAYMLTWVSLVIISLSIMVGLYSGVVYTLWFKRDNNHQFTYQQKVRATCSWIIFQRICSLACPKLCHTIIYM